MAQIPFRHGQVIKYVVVKEVWVLKSALIIIIGSLVITWFYLLLCLGTQQSIPFLLNSGEMSPAQHSDLCFSFPRTATWATKCCRVSSLSLTMTDGDTDFLFQPTSPWTRSGSLPCTDGHLWRTGSPLAASVEIFYALRTLCLEIIYLQFFDTQSQLFLPKLGKSEGKHRRCFSHHLGASPPAIPALPTIVEIDSLWE